MGAVRNHGNGPSDERFDANYFSIMVLLAYILNFINIWDGPFPTYGEILWFLDFGVKRLKVKVTMRDLWPTFEKTLMLAIAFIIFSLTVRYILFSSTTIVMVIGDKYPIAYIYIIKRILILEPWMNTFSSEIRTYCCPVPDFWPLVRQCCICCVVCWTNCVIGNRVL